jgi:hypothetical protein
MTGAPLRTATGLLSTIFSATAAAAAAALLPAAPPCAASAQAAQCSRGRGCATRRRRFCWAAGGPRSPRRSACRSGGSRSGGRACAAPRAARPWRRRSPRRAATRAPARPAHGSPGVSAARFRCAARRAGARTTKRTSLGSTLRKRPPITCAAAEVHSTCGAAGGTCVSCPQRRSGESAAAARAHTRTRTTKSAAPMSASSARSSTWTKRCQCAVSHARPSRRQRASAAEAWPAAAEARPTEMKPATGATTGVAQETRQANAAACVAGAGARCVRRQRAARHALRRAARHTRLRGCQRRGEGAGRDGGVRHERRSAARQVLRELHAVLPRRLRAPARRLAVPLRRRHRGAPVRGWALPFLSAAHVCLFESTGGVGHAERARRAECCAGAGRWCSGPGRAGAAK